MKSQMTFHQGKSKEGGHTRTVSLWGVWGGGGVEYIAVQGRKSALVGPKKSKRNWGSSGLSKARCKNPLMVIGPTD